jgi:hypothetical protein
VSYSKSWPHARNQCRRLEDSQTNEMCCLHLLNEQENLGDGAGAGRDGEPP